MLRCFCKRFFCAAQSLNAGLNGRCRIFSEALLGDGSTLRATEEDAALLLSWSPAWFPGGVEPSRNSLCLVQPEHVVLLGSVLTGLPG